MARREGLLRCNGVHCGIKHSADFWCLVEEKEKLPAMFNRVLDYCSALDGERIWIFGAVYHVA